MFKTSNCFNLPYTLDVLKPVVLCMGSNLELKFGALTNFRPLIYDERLKTSSPHLLTLLHADTCQDAVVTSLQIHHHKMFYTRRQKPLMAASPYKTNICQETPAKYMKGPVCWPLVDWCPHWCCIELGNPYVSVH